MGFCLMRVCQGGFCLMGFCLMGFCQGGFCLMGFCLMGFCPGVSAYIGHTDLRRWDQRKPQSYIVIILTHFLFQMTPHVQCFLFDLNIIKKPELMYKYWASQDHDPCNCTLKYYYILFGR